MKKMHFKDKCPENSRNTFSVFGKYSFEGFLTKLMDGF